MKKLGIIGGLGPMATAYFLQLITQMSDAATDQEHMEIYVISKPSIPDRTDYILGLSDRSPAEEMSAVGAQLKSLGAELLAMPCVTGHYFHQEIEKNVMQSKKQQIIFSIEESEKSVFWRQWEQ